MKSLLPYLFCVIIGIVLTLFFMKGCNKPCNGGTVIQIKHDTSYVQIPPDSSVWHYPSAIDSEQLQEPGDIENAIRTGQYCDTCKYSLTPIEEIVKRKPKAVVKTKINPEDYTTDAEKGDTTDGPSFFTDYFTQFHYKEPYHFGKGVVTVESYVSANRLDSQRVFLSGFEQQVITNTITKEVAIEKHNEIYLGVSAMGNLQMPFYAFGPSLSFKTKSDRVLEAGVLYTRNSSIMYQFGIKTKISLHKQ